MMLECSAEKSRSVWVSVAELSGDIHAADLVKALTLRCPALKFRGIAGPSLMAFSEKVGPPAARFGLAQLCRKMRPRAHHHRKRAIAFSQIVDPQTLRVSANST